MQEPNKTNAVTMCEPDKLLPYAGNARKHSTRQLNQLVASLREFGFVNPVLVDANNMIIAGHGRVAAAKKLGLTQVPTFCVDHLSEAQKKAYSIADNRLSAHYGSISMVTFVTAVSFLGINQVAYAGFIVAVVALMEAPAIVSGLFLANKKSAGNDALQQAQHPRLPLAEIMTNGAIVLLLGAFAVGYATGPSGMEKMYGFLVTPFHGVLALFLLDMGLVVAREASHLKMLTLRLAAFGIYMPILSALLALVIAYVIGLDQGTAFLFVVLCASASYIAVPAAMRHALPEAKASVYIPLSLAITFPFNIILGLPAYFAITQTIFAG